MSIARPVLSGTELRWGNGWSFAENPGLAIRNEFPDAGIEAFTPESEGYKTVLGEAVQFAYSVRGMTGPTARSLLAEATMECDFDEPRLVSRNVLLPTIWRMTAPMKRDDDRETQTGGPMAYALAFPSASGPSRILLGVAERYRGHRISQVMLRWWREGGAGDTEIWVAGSNRSALTILVASGYTPIAVREDGTTAWRGC